MFPVDMDPLFMLLEMTRGIEQKIEHHPEVDVFDHSIQTMNWAFKETDDTDLILAAMLHDVGKALNTLGHDQIGADWLEDFVSTKTIWLIRQHLRVWYLMTGKMKRKAKVRELIEHPWLPELVLLARWDKLGRNPNYVIKYNKEDIVERLNKLTEEHFKGEVVSYD